MTRYCCPDCEDHPILDDELICVVCGGGFYWKEGGKVQEAEG